MGHLVPVQVPDCFEKFALTINGEAPGPTIRATQGDTIVVTVRNHLETENTAIHWHGIRQVRIHQTKHCRPASISSFASVLLFSCYYVVTASCNVRRCVADWHAMG